MRLPPIMVGRRWQFAGLLVIGVVQGALAVGWAFAVGEVLRRVGRDPTSALVICGVLAGLAVVTAGLLVGERVLAERLGQGWVNQVRVTVFEQVARDKLNEVLARPVRHVGRAAAPAGSGRLVLAGVCLDGVFGPLHAVVEAGTVVALTGPNGAGKSSLLTVLAGLETPSAGSVLLDGAPLHDIEPA